MSHDERIEAMARAICAEDFGNAHEWDDTTSEILRESYRDQAIAALAAAGIEEIVRSGIDAYRDMLSDALSADLENGVQWLNQRAAGTFSCDYPELCKALEMDAEKIVREVMGK
jgi:hypothetical protein